MKNLILRPFTDYDKLTLRMRVIQRKTNRISLEIFYSEIDMLVYAFTRYAKNILISNKGGLCAHKK